MASARSRWATSGAPDLLVAFFLARAFLPFFFFAVAARARGGTTISELGLVVQIVRSGPESSGAMFSGTGDGVLG